MTSHAESSPSPGADQPKPRFRGGLGLRIGLGLIVVTAVAIGLWLGWDSLRLETLADRETELREFVEDRPILSFTVAVGLYFLVTALSLPVAGPLSLLYGWLFGFGASLVIVSFASTAGATLAFLLSRYLFRDLIERTFGTRLETLNENLDREGPFYLATLRLIPVIPFWVINLVMGLTRMRAVTFWLVSQLGMLPGTALYVWTGSTVPSLAKIRDGDATIWNAPMIASFVALALVPIALRTIVNRLRSRPIEQTTETTSSGSD